MSVGVIGEFGYYEVYMYVVECFLVLWCMFVCFGVYMVVVVNYGLIIYFVDEFLYCGVIVYVGVKVCVL